MLTGTAVIAGLVVLGITFAVLLQRPWFQGWIWEKIVLRESGRTPSPPPDPARDYDRPEPAAPDLASAEALFVPTNVWSAQLRFTASEWEALQPERIRRTPGWIRPDGSPNLRNPLAPRAGLAGVLGFAQPWSKGTFTFAGIDTPDVAVRFKGNGTFIEALGSYRRPFKLDFEKGHPGRRFAGQTELNLHNLVADPSCLNDALGYEFFREAGVPAPRTTYTRLFLGIDGQWDRRLLGLYLIVEDPDPDWLAGIVGSTNGALFKPVTLDLFSDLGDDWKPYEEIYDPKGTVAPPQQRRLIDLAKLVTHADDPTFAGRIGDFVDLDAFARYLACLVLLSNYDSLLDNGQNFLLWLDPRNDRFAFGPWDLDHSWGSFPLIGTREQRERASIWHPWVGSNRFLERLLKVDSFRERYRSELTRLLDTRFVPDRLNRRIDQLADAIRPAVAEQSPESLRRFERVLGDAKDHDRSEATPDDSRSRHGDYRLRHFIAVRATEVRAQLEDRSGGVVIHRRR